MNRLTDFKTNRPKETNFEHFKDEILNLINIEDGLAVKKGTPISCGAIKNCNDCDFKNDNNDCAEAFIYWGYQEYKGDIYLTDMEYNLLIVLNKGYIVRDHHNQLFYYENPPSKIDGCWESEPGYVVNLSFIDSFKLPFIKYESSIWSVDQLLELEVKNV